MSFPSSPYFNAYGGEVDIPFTQLAPTGSVSRLGLTIES